jgi:branched-chain amino acid transport system permease protein
VVFATLIGGSGSLYGPIIGSFVFIWLSESMSVVWTRWPLLLGVAFVIVVLFFRGGVVEAWTRLVKWHYSRQKISANPSAR